MKRLSWIITVPLLAVVVIFALSNRGVAELDLWPLPFQVTAPVFALVLLSVFVGFLLGALVMWLHGGRRRREQRELRRHADSLSRDVADLSRKLAPQEETGGSNDNVSERPAHTTATSHLPEVARGKP